jgi:hypothetical protein
MTSSIVRKMTTLGVGLSLLAAGLATAGPASAKLCYRTDDGVTTSYTCYEPDPPTTVPPPPGQPAPPKAPAPVATKLGLLTKARTVSGPTTVSVAAKLTDLRGRPRSSASVNLCWKAVTATKESCAARKTNPDGVASVGVTLNTATTVRAVANATKYTRASKSPTAVVRVSPKATVVAGVRTLSVSLKPLTRVKVKLQKKVGSRYVTVRAAYTSTRGTIKLTKLTKGAYYRVYVYASGGRNAVYSSAARVR